MADELKSQDQTQPTPEQSLAHQYELEGAPPESSEPTPPSAPEGPPDSPPASSDSPPRNPDGTFAKRDKPKHSARVVRLAHEFGFSDATIDNLAPEALEDAVYDLVKERLQAKADGSKESILAGDRAQPAPAKVQEAVEQETIDWGKDDEGKPLSEDDHAPVVRSLAKDNAELKRQLKSLSARLAELEGREVARHNESLARRADRVFQKNADLFGAGSVHELDRSSAEYDRRMAVLQAAERIQGGSIEERLTKATERLFPGRQSAEKKAEPAVKQREKDWEEGSLSKPTHRKGAAEPPSRSKAVRAVEDYLKQNGADATAEEQLAEFPG